MKILSFILAVLINFSTPIPLYAAEKNWEIRNYQTVRIDRKRKKDHTYLMRLASLMPHRFCDDLDIKLETQPFLETQYKWDIEECERVETGIEVGFCIAEWAYIGESFHYAWLKAQDDTPEFETRLEMYIPFVLNSNGYKLTLALIEEYTYGAEEHKATRNEIAANFIIPVVGCLEFICGWRHIDRIHEYDSDQVELSALFKF